MGTSTQASGYDGQPWEAGNGIVTTIDLPARVADARSQAFVDRAGWRDPSVWTGVELVSRSSGPNSVIRYRLDGAGEIEVVPGDGSNPVTQVTIETDNGPLVTRFEDWRPVGSMSYPFRQVQTDNTGATTVLHARSVRIRSCAPRIWRGLQRFGTDV